MGLRVLRSSMAHAEEHVSRLERGYSRTLPVRLGNVTLRGTNCPSKPLCGTLWNVGVGEAAAATAVVLGVLHVRVPAGPEPERPKVLQLHLMEGLTTVGPQPHFG